MSGIFGTFRRYPVTFIKIISIKICKYNWLKREWGDDAKKFAPLTRGACLRDIIQDKMNFSCYLIIVLRK
jgi:hypothetical protein